MAVAVASLSDYSPGHDETACGTSSWSGCGAAGGSPSGRVRSGAAGAAAEPAASDWVAHRPGRRPAGLGAVTAVRRAPNLPLGLRIRAAAGLEDLLALARRCRLFRSPSTGRARAISPRPRSPGRRRIASRSSASRPSATRTRWCSRSTATPAEPGEAAGAARRRSTTSSARRSAFPMTPISRSTCRPARRRRSEFAQLIDRYQRAGAGRRRAAHGLRLERRARRQRRRRRCSIAARLGDRCRSTHRTSSSKGRPAFLSPRPRSRCRPTAAARQFLAAGQRRRRARRHSSATHADADAGRRVARPGAARSRSPALPRRRRRHRPRRPLAHARPRRCSAASSSTSCPACCRCCR